MLQSEIFVFEFVAVNGFSSSTVVIGEIASLAHEIRNYSMEYATSVSETFFAGAEGAKILRRSRYHVAAQLARKKKKN